MRGGGHHCAPGGAGTGKQKVVEGQLGKLNPDAAGFIKESQFFFGEIGWHFRNQEGCQISRILRHLDHRAIAGGEDTHHRYDAQIDRKIPRHDDADNPDRLRNHPVLGTEIGRDIDVPPLRLHPAFEV